jgi:TPR repeat protein/serine/threonine protein kinase
VKAADFFQKAVNAGHVKALNSLGVCYVLGFGVKRNVAKGIELFEQGVAQGEASAMFNFGNAFAKGQGVEQDLRKALELYEKASALGDLDAMYLLAIWFMEGTNVVKNHSRAADLLQKCVDGGHVKAPNHMGICYSSGFGIKKDYARALELFQLGANQGDIKATVSLGKVYAQGHGVEANMSKALDLYRGAAKLGDDESLCLIGLAYQKGAGILKDEHKAVELFKKAADLGNIRACNLLGFCYLKGRGVSKNPKQGAVYFEMAAQKDDTNGMFNLANAYLIGEGVAKDETTALEWYQKAADAGDVDSLYSLAICIGNGQGTEKDFAKSLSLLEKAAERKNPRALFKLGQLYEEGSEVPKDMARCLGYYRKASQLNHKEADSAYHRLILETLPDSIRSGTKKQVEQFVEDIVKGGSVMWKKAKIMVLGKEGVGKTHLYHRLRSLSYDLNLSTDGIDVHSFKLNDVELTWFDFGGQAIFYSTHQFFLTAQCVYLVCFKFGDEESLERANYWLRNIRSFSYGRTRPAKVVVVGTHADVFPEEVEQQLVWDELKQAMDANGHVIGRIAVSCHTGEGFEGVKRGIELALDSAKLRAVQVPRSYQMIETFILESRRATPKLSWKEVFAMFPALNENQLQQAFDFFADMGLCLVERRLQLLITDPQWLASTFSTLVSFSQSWVKNGTVAAADLTHVWKAFSEHETEQVMGLFESFQVAFAKRKEGLWVVPSLLPEDRPFDTMLDFVPGRDVQLYERMFKFEILPSGLFGRLIARLQEWSADGVVITHMWRDGFVIETPGKSDIAEIVVKALPDGHAVVVRCKSSRSGSHSSLSLKPVGASTSRGNLGLSSHRRRSPRPGDLQEDIAAVAAGTATLRLRGSFIQRLVEECTSLFNAAFDKGAEESSVQHLVACPHCLRDASLVETPTYVPFTACVELVLSQSATLKCSGRYEVPMDGLGDDITFGYVRVFKDDEIQLEEKHFASGGFGNIFRGVMNGQVIVAKELKPEKVKEGFSEFQHETSLMSRLQAHPNIVQLFGIMLRPMRMIVEFCPEGDLLHALRAGKLKNNDALCYKVAIDICSGMAFLHSQNPPLAHRDLRSPNILLMSLDPNQKVCAKVADFGLTLSVTERLRDPLPTWQWMAPEAQMGENYTELCDLYSFGIILFEIFSGTGEVPFSEFSASMRQAEIFPKLRSGELRPTIPAGVPQWLKELISRQWDNCPTLRMPFDECGYLIAKQSGRQVKPLSLRKNPFAAHRGRQVAAAMPDVSSSVLLDISNDFPVCMALGNCCWVALNSGKLICMDPISHEVLERDYDYEVKCLCSSGSCVWAGCFDGTLVMLEGCLGDASSFHVGNGDLTCILSLSHDLLLVGDSCGGLHLFSIEQQEVVASCSIGIRKAVVHGCGVTESLVWVAVASGDLYCVNVEKGPGGFSLKTSLLHRLGHEEAITGMVCTGSHVWTSGSDIRVWDAKTAALLLALPTDKVHCMSAVSFHGTSTIWTGRTGQIVVWDVKKRVMVRTLECEGVVHCVSQAGLDKVWTGMTTHSGDGNLVEWTL